MCGLLNRAIREDDPITTIHAAVFANAINMLLFKDRDKPQSWLQKLFSKSHPCVNVGQPCDWKGDRMFLRR